MMLRGLCGLALLGICSSVGMADSSSAERMPADNGDHYVTYTGIANARRSGAFIYREQHVLKYRSGRLTERVVLYTCRDGSSFARKTVAYVDALAPDFHLEDASNGMREGIRSGGGTRTVFFRESGVVAEKSGALPSGGGLVADAGFDEFIRMNWQSLMSGRSMSLRFVVPSRLDDMRFDVQHLRSETDGGTASEVFRLKLAAPLGWVLPGIDVYYSAGEHVLTRYVGLSDLRDASHDNFQTEILFRPGDRKVTGEHSIDAARQARLAPCK